MIAGCSSVYIICTYLCLFVVLFVVTDLWILLQNLKLNYENGKILAKFINITKLDLKNSILY